jgi:phage FluMu protein Com
MDKPSDLYSDFPSSSLGGSTKEKPMWTIRGTASKGDYIYAIVPDHPRATKNGYVLEHRIVMENHLGRMLTEEELVHHKNENKRDNNIANLEITDKHEHARNHGFTHGHRMLELRCPWCKTIFLRGYNNTHLGKKCGSATYCNGSCRGKMGRAKQLGRISIEEYNAATKDNVIREFREVTT